MNKILNRRTLILFVIIFNIGAAIIWRVAQSTEKQMRTVLLKQARIAAHAVNTKNITSLTATKKDLNTLAYQRIKKQLALIRNTDNQYRFLYLMGQRSNGVIFFFVDSLPVDSENYASPGLIYEEISDSYRRVFTTKKEAVVGPITDRWGTLVTALIPIQDPDTGNLIAILGMDIDASGWNKTIFWRCAFPAVIILLIWFLILLLIFRYLAIKTQLENEKKYRLLKDTLWENEEKLRNIIENSTNLFYSHTPDHILTYLSPQTKDILGYTVEEAMIKWAELASDNPINEKGFQKTITAIETAQTQTPHDLELLHKNGKKVLVEIRETPVVKEGKTVAIVGLATDITERKQAEKVLREAGKKQEKIIKKLQDALDEVKTLSGLLPICANCKKIRDDKGYWNNLESYIQTHSEASFSHGMCTECSDELYGKEDWYIEMKKKKE